MQRGIKNSGRDRIIYFITCGYHVPEPTRLAKMSKPLQPSRHRFWKLAWGTREICHVWDTPRSLPLHVPLTHPPRRMHRLADSPQRDFGRPRWIVFFTGELREHWQLLAHRSHSLPCTGASCTSGISPHPLLSLPLSTACRISPCCHTLRRRSSTVRTLCLRREKWDHDPPTVSTTNLKNLINYTAAAEFSTTSLTCVQSCKERNFKYSPQRYLH